MTAAEIIAILSDFPPTTPVVLWDGKVVREFPLAELNTFTGPVVSFGKPMNDSRDVYIVRELG